jgi:hypothetical protein
VAVPTLFIKNILALKTTNYPTNLARQMKEKCLRKNYAEFLQAVDAVKKLLLSSRLVKAEKVLELTKIS